MHDPVALAERGRRGGQRRAEAVQHDRVAVGARLEALKLKTLGDVRELLREAVRLSSASAEPNTVRARALTRIAAVALKVISDTDIARGMDDLRDMIEQLGGQERGLQ